MAFRILYSDITKLEVDAIVNPTDRFYSGGGGVDWLIHSICGEQLYEATRKLPRLHLGEAKATPGFGLPCKYIIHTSGPKWKESHFLEVSLLGSCYRNSVQLAYNLGCRSIAFPLVSSRGKHFPKEQALTTAIHAILECVREYPDMDIILTIYGKWTEAVPKGFFEDLSKYVSQRYKPGEELVEEPPRRTRITRIVSENKPIACEEPHEQYRNLTLEARRVDPAIITRLIENPTQDNLDKIPIDGSFSNMLNQLIQDRNVKVLDILNELGISRAALSKLRNGKSNPSKLTVFALAIFFKLSIEETEEMMMKAGFAINPSSVQDVILSALISDKRYDRYIIDDLLYDLDLQPLPGATTC